MFSQIRISPDHQLKDFSAWNRIALRNLVVLVLLFGAFSVAYFVWKAHAVTPDQFEWGQRILGKMLVGAIFTQIGWMALRNWQTVRGLIAAFLYSPSSAETLALFRILYLLQLTGHIASFIPNGLAHVTSLPPSARQPLPFMGWLIDALPISTGLFQVACAVTVVFCVLALVGFRTRLSLILAGIGLLFVLGVPNFFGSMKHTHFMVWGVWFLAFSPCGDKWSVDAFLRQRRGEIRNTEAHWRYGLALKLILLQLAALYFFSGVGKLWLAGMKWGLSDNLAYLMRLTWMDGNIQPPAFRLDLYPILCQVLAMGVILFELCYIFLILTPKTRVSAMVEALFFHNATHYFLQIEFRFLQFLNFFLVDWVPVFRKWGQPGGKWLVIALLAVLAGATFWWNMAFALLFAAGMVVVWLKKGSNGESGPANPISPWNLRLGLAILSINGVFGLFQVHSWPFSAYPSYSYLRRGTVERIWFVPRMKDGTTFSLARLHGDPQFRHENNQLLGEWAFQRLAEGDSAFFEAKMMQYWLHILEKEPELKDCQSAGIVRESQSTNPDTQYRIEKSESVGILRKGEGGWIWDPSGI